MSSVGNLTNASRWRGLDIGSDEWPTCFDDEAQDAVECILSLVRDRLEAAAAHFVLVEPAHTILQATTAAPDPVSAIDGISLVRRLSRRAAADLSPLVIVNAAEDPRVGDPLAMVEEGVLAFAGVAIAAPAGPVVGALCVTKTRRHAWRVGEVSLIEGMAVVLEAELRHCAGRHARLLCAA